MAKTLRYPLSACLCPTDPAVLLFDPSCEHGALVHSHAQRSRLAENPLLGGSADVVRENRISAVNMESTSNEEWLPIAPLGLNPVAA